MVFSLWSLQGALLCISFFFAGIVDSVCGGGGLLTLPMFMSVGFPVRLITGTNQLSTVGGGITALTRYLRGGHVDLRTALPAIPFTIIGATLGARLNLYLPERYLKLVLIVLLPIVAVILLLRRDFGAEDRSSTLSRRRILLNAMIIGLIIGCYQGFYGAGAGTFFMLGFALLDRLDLITASGNTKVIALCSCLTAGVTYALSDTVLWSVVPFTTLFNIAGSYIGSGLALTKGARVIRPMFFIIIGILFIRLLSSLPGL